MRLTRRSSESRLVPDVVECIDCLWCRVRASTTVLFYKRGYEALGLAHWIPGHQDEVRGTHLDRSAEFRILLGSISRVQGSRN